MTAEGLIAWVTRLLQEDVTARELDTWLVDTPGELFVFQKGGPHYALVVKSASIEVDSG